MSPKAARALVVDDKVENLYMLESLLKGTGFAVTRASNGAAALKLARTEKPDIVISDILMPVMDGFSLCREWRADPGLKDVPFVFYTATYTDPKDEKLALSLGADMFIIKPKDPMEFLSLIHEVLRRERAGELGKGAEPPAPEDSYLREYNQVLVHKLEKKVEDLAKANLDLRSALADKMTLVRELFHRTGNSLQLVSSILELEAMTSGGPETDRVVRGIASRIKALSLISRRLYESHSVSRIDLRAYLTELAEAVRRAHPSAARRVRVDCEIEPQEVLIDAAIPAGLVVNELLSNAYRHAFPEGRGGTVRLRCRRCGEGELELSVGDDGAGFPEGVDPKDPKTLGLRIVKVLVEQQLQGSVEFRSAGGVECRARFKDGLYVERV